VVHWGALLEVQVVSFVATIVLVALVTLAVRGPATHEPGTAVRALGDRRPMAGERNA
jgi:hypothetical protein